MNTLFCILQGKVCVGDVLDEMCGECLKGVGKSGVLFFFLFICSEVSLTEVITKRSNKKQYWDIPPKGLQYSKSKSGIAGYLHDKRCNIMLCHRSSKNMGHVRSKSRSLVRTSYFIVAMWNMFRVVIFFVSRSDTKLICIMLDQNLFHKVCIFNRKFCHVLEPW